MGSFIEDMGDVGEEEDMGGFIEEDDEERGPMGKVTNAFGMLCLGIVLFPSILGLVGWNEKRSVCESKDIMFAEDKTTDLGSTHCETPGAAAQNLNKFVFFSCPVNKSALHTWTPNSFGMDPSLTNAFSFKSPVASQLVQMYQCVETAHKETKGSGNHKRTRTTYTYKMEWAADYQDDTAFSNVNSVQHVQGHGCPLPWKGPGSNIKAASHQGTTSKTVRAGEVKTGPFIIDEKLAAAFDTNVDVVVTTLGMKPPHGFVSKPVQSDSVLNLTSFTPSGKYMVTCHPHDALNCMRISYRMNSDADVSVMAKIGSGGLTEPAETPPSWGCSGGPWSRIDTKKVTKSQFVEHLHEANQAITWLLRIIGILGAWGAVYCCLAPISAAADLLGDCLNFIPFFGGIMEQAVEGVVTAVLCFMSCMCGSSAALFVIAIVWVAMRPLYGIGLLAVALGFFGIAIAIGRQHVRPVKSREIRNALLASNSANQRRGNGCCS